MVQFVAGDAHISRVHEMLGLGMDAGRLFRNYDPTVVARHPELADPRIFDTATGRVISSIHSWLIRIGGKVVLVDTGGGNGKPRALPIFARFHMREIPYLENLAAIGLAPEDIDVVFCTHLHVDHVGWNTRLVDGRWVPTFPNAEYVFGRAEYEHWTGSRQWLERFPENEAVIDDSVLPIVEQARLRLVDDGDEIAPGLRAELAPGHTMTQMILKHEAADGGFVCTADCFHHPIQVHAPDITSIFAEDMELAVATRRRLFDDASRSGALLLPSHVGYPFCGYVHASGDGFAFEPAKPLAAASARRTGRSG